MPDINVIITDQNKGITIAGFGLPLVVSTKKDVEYKEVDITEGLDGIQKDFLVSTEAYKLCEAIAKQEPKPGKIAIFGKNLTASKESRSKAEQLTEALSDLVANNNDFYRVLLDDTTDELIKTVSDFAEANNKMFYTLSKNVKSDLTGNSRTVLFNKENDERIDGATVGFSSPRTPGSYTLKFKNLNEITADGLKPTQIAELRKKNINAYVKKYGIAQLDEAKTANGMYVDQVESRDYVKNQIETEIATLFVNSEKIPYDNLGIQSVATAVITALNRATDVGIVARDTGGKALFEVTYKTLNQIPKADRQKRKLTGIKFKYVEAGAIHEATVNGSVVAEL